MNTNPQHDQIQDEVLERIRSGKVHMKPRIFFVLKTALVAMVGVLILLTSVWLASFISFGLRMSGNESLLGFGTRGPVIFLMLFPWGLALLDLLLVVLLVWLLRRFKFGYRNPFLYLLGAILLGGVAAGLIFDRDTQFHDDRYEEAEAGMLPGVLESLYESAHTNAPEEHGIYRGYVLDIREGTFVLTNNDRDRDSDDGAWLVTPPRSFDLQSIRIGDRVYVAGDRDGREIEAYGVRILDRK